MANANQRPVPSKAAAELEAALRAKLDADKRLKDAVVTALKSGASVRSVATLTGLSTNTVQRWGRAGGWPTPEQLAERERSREWLALTQAVADGSFDVNQAIADAALPQEGSEDTS